jgi:hypothetical protein
MGRRGGWAGVGLAGLLLVPAPRPAAALSIDAASVWIGARGGDGFKLRGRLGDLSLAGAAGLRVELDGLGLEVPMERMKRRGRKLIYRRRGRAPGLAKLVVDARRGRFTAAADGLALGAFASPVALRVSTDQGEACQILRLAPKGRRRRRSTRLTLARGHVPGEACLVGAPVLDPTAVVVGEAADVRVEVELAAVPDPDSVRLHRAGADGRPAGDALCVLRDDGDPATGDAVAGDGVHTCRTSLAETAPGTIPLLVEASIGGTRTVSPGVELMIVPPLGEADAAAIMAGQEAARDAWAAALARHGDSLAARVETVRALRGAPGVHDVRLEGENGSITVVYDSGVVGGLALTPRFVPAGAAPVAAARALRPGPRPRPRPAAAERVRPGNARVLLWDTGFFGASEAEKIRYLMTASACPRFDVTLLKNDDASLAALRTMTAFGTVGLTSHGDVKLAGIYAATLETRESVNLGTLQTYADDLQHGRLWTRDGPGEPDSLPENWGPRLYVTPAWIENLPGTFDDAIVWGGFCYSTAFAGSTAGMPLAFLARGAATYYGFTWEVSDPWAKEVAPPLFGHLVAEGKATGESFGLILPKIDPYMPAHPANQFFPEGVRARFTAHGELDAYYLGAPTIGPEDPTVGGGKTLTLTADLPGGDDCDLIYRWTSTGSAGTLKDGAGHEDGFDTTTPTVTYEAGDAVGTDTVTLEVLVEEGGEERSLGTTSAEVSVVCLKCQGSALPLAGTDVCTPAESCCTDGKDNDQDGDTDCDDTDCADEPACGELITNGDFSAGLSSWTQVKLVTSFGGGFPKFTPVPTHGCVAASDFFEFDVPGNADGYLEQEIDLPPAPPTTLGLTVWGNLDPVTVTISVFADGTDHLLDTFVPAASQALDMGTCCVCSGATSVRKAYSLAAYKGKHVAVRLRATASGTNGTIVNFDDVSVRAGGG